MRQTTLLRRLGVILVILLPVFAFIASFTQNTPSYQCK